MGADAKEIAPTFHAALDEYIAGVEARKAEVTP
jgi:hypothetical protein